MKTAEWIFILIFAVIFTLVCASGITAEILFKEGAKTSRLFYEATGQFPTEDWLHRNIYKGYDCPQEIEDSLKPH